LYLKKTAFRLCSQKQRAVAHLFSILWEEATNVIE